MGKGAQWMDSSRMGTATNTVCRQVPPSPRRTRVSVSLKVPVHRLASITTGVSQYRYSEKVRGVRAMRARAVKVPCQLL